MSKDFRNDYDWSNVTDPITNEEAITWVAALRSGEFKQGKHLLVDTKGNYCCLGVANEVLDVGCDTDQGTLRKHDDENSLFEKLPIELQTELYMLNDTKGWTFEQIADEIERGFKLQDRAEEAEVYGQLYPDLKDTPRL